MRRRGVTLTAFVLAAVCVMALATMLASAQTTSCVRTVERVQARRMRDAAAAAAFDETAAVLEAGFPPLSRPAADRPRDLAREVRWPGRTATLAELFDHRPVVAGSLLAPAGVAFPGPVSVRASSFEFHVASEPAGVRERAILTMSVAVRVRFGGTVSAARVTVRRQIATTASGSDVRLRVLPGVLGREIVELP